MFKRLIYILTLSLKAENHKTLSFFGSYDPLIWTNFNAYNLSKNDNGQSPFGTALQVQDKKIHYSLDSKKINFQNNGFNTAFPPSQDLFIVKLDHSFDEIFDDIYYGLSIAYLKSNLSSKKPSSGSFYSFYKTSALGIGGYLQYQDEEETDYNFVIKFSLLGLAQWISLKQFHDKLISDFPLIYQEINAPLTLGVLGLFQIGFKIGFLEITAFVGYNWSSHVTHILNTKTTAPTHCSNFYIGIAIGFLFQ